MEDKEDKENREDMEEELKTKAENTLEEDREERFRDNRNNEWDISILFPSNGCKEFKLGSTLTKRKAPESIKTNKSNYLVTDDKCPTLSLLSWSKTQISVQNQLKMNQPKS